MVDIDPAAQNDPTFGGIINRLDAWRLRQRMLGTAVYDAPDWENGRLYFRSGYVDGLQWPHWKEQGEWSAYILEPTAHGYTNVLQSSKGERDVHRHERVLAAFTRVEDAGKFVIGRVGNAVRVSSGLDSIFVQWKKQGTDTRVQVGDPDPGQLQYMREVCGGIRPGLLEDHLRRYFLARNPDAVALPLPSEVPLMNVMPLTFDELDFQLTRGMPHDVVSS